ncbi:MAG: ttgR [Actinomycetia bacterium]|nr:ttgR [Actinomycetes bacterium]
MREIRIAAEQRNVGALTYHFGDLDGLLRALLERELPLLVERRRTLLAEAIDGDAWSVAAVFVLPFAEMATGSEHERYVVQFLSELHDDVSFSIEDIFELIGDTGAADAYQLLRAQIADVTDEVLAERVRVGTNSYLHAAAIWARGRRRAHLVSDALFRENLVDMFLGSMVVR